MSEVYKGRWYLRGTFQETDKVSVMINRGGALENVQVVCGGMKEGTLYRVLIFPRGKLEQESECVSSQVTLAGEKDYFAVSLKAW